MADPHSNLFVQALEYFRLGWSIIPIPRDTKRAWIGWKQYQQQRPDEEAIRLWFRHGRQKNLAVVLGPVSGGLICRDFDVPAVYEAWAQGHPELAAMLPTVKTGSGGYHVYCLSDFEGVKHYSDGSGELRSTGGYCLLPPSVHPTGPEYRWIHRPDGIIPRVNDWRSVFGDNFTQSAGVYTEDTRQHRRSQEDSGGEGTSISSEIDADVTQNAPHKPDNSSLEVVQRVQSSTETTENTETTETTETTEDNRRQLRQQMTLAPNSDEFGSSSIDRIISETLPKRPGTRNKLIFHLARRLRSLPGYWDADPMEFKGVLERWFQAALPNINTKEFSESFNDFTHAWESIKWTTQDSPFIQIVERAKSMNTPQWLQDKYPMSPKFYELFNLCRELQADSKEEPFYLSCRTAGQLLGLKHTTASRCLKLLIREGVLTIVTKGGTSESPRKATRYRFCEVKP